MPDENKIENFIPEDNLPEKFDEQKLILHWIMSSEQDYSAMCDMFNTKHYNWSLFLGHLVIEKLLKACFIKKNNQFPPLIHNLLRLAEQSSIELDIEKTEFFATVTNFNLNARYDDYKQSFYELCTREYTEIWFNKIKEYSQWIKLTYLQ